MTISTDEPDVLPISVRKESAAGDNAGRVSVSWLETGIRWFLGMLLLWAGLSKLADPVSFYGVLLGYQLSLPSILLKLTATTLPWMELLCGLFLIDFARRGALI